MKNAGRAELFVVGADLRVARGNKTIPNSSLYTGLT